MKKIIAILVMAFFGVFWQVDQIKAADLEVTCNQDGCSPGNSAYLFPDSEVWTPGKYMTKTFKINNQSGNERQVAVRSANKAENGNLDTVLDLYIRKSGETSNIWVGSMNNFLSENRVDLERVNNGENKEFEFTVNFDPAAGNIHQGSTLSFDLIFSYINISDNPAPTETPAASFSGGSDNSNNQTNAVGGNINPAASNNTVRTGTTADLTDFFSPLPEIPEISGAATTSGEVVGVGIMQKIPPGQCNSNRWWMFLLLQTVIGNLVIRRTNFGNLKTNIFSLSGIYALDNLIILNYFCIEPVLALWATTVILLLSIFIIERKLKILDYPYIHLAV